MRHALLFFLVVVSFLFLFWAGPVCAALDAPHDYSGPMAMGCDSCHYPSTEMPLWLFQPVAGDNTYMNNLCTSCHHEGNESAETRYKNIKTHSSRGTTGKYGSWMVECKVCHNSHNQSQATLYPLEGNLESGLLTDATYTLVRVANPLPSGVYRKYLLMPDLQYPTFSYRIKENSADTILTTGNISMRGSSGSIFVKPGSTYGIKYGGMVRTPIVGSAGSRQVKFFNNEGPNSFADGDAVVDGVCQVCHTRTASFRSDGVLEATGHPADTAGTNCMRCHPHSSGFQAVAP